MSVPGRRVLDLAALHLLQQAMAGPRFSADPIRSAWGPLASVLPAMPEWRLLASLDGYPLPSPPDPLYTWVYESTSALIVRGLEAKP